MSRGAELSRGLSRSEHTLTEDTSIKHRLRSASKPVLFSEGRQTPITVPSEDMARYEPALEPATSTGQLSHDDWFDNALRTMLPSAGDTPPPEPRFSALEAEDRMRRAYMAAVEEKQQAGVEQFNREADERITRLRRGLQPPPTENKTHTGKVTYHTAHGQLWLRDEMPGRPVRLVKLEYTDLPRAAVVVAGLPEENVVKEDPADAEVNVILGKQPTDTLPRGESETVQPPATLMRPISTSHSESKINITQVRGSAFQEYNAASNAELLQMKETMEKMAAQMAEMQRRERERLSQEVDTEKKRSVRKRQKEQMEEENDFSDEDFVYTKSAKPEAKRAAREKARAESRCSRELFIPQGNGEVTQDNQQPPRKPSTSKSVDSLEVTKEQLGQPIWPMMDLPVFEGEQWQLFIDSFETMARLSKWTPEQKLVKFLPCIKGAPRMYLEADEDDSLTFEDARNRLAERYGSNMSEFEVRQRIRNMKRRPGESMESFADRLQAASQRGRIDRADKNELFYRAFLDAVSDSPKLQLYLEREHKKNRNARLPDLLRMVREYRERSPARDSDLDFAVNVCLPAEKRKGALTHADTSVASDVVQEEKKVADEKVEREERKEKMCMRDVGYALTELEWVKKVIKANGLHGNLPEKLRNLGEEKSYQEPMGEPLTEKELERIRNSDFYNRSAYNGGRGRGNRPRGRGNGRGYGNRNFYGVTAEDADGEEDQGEFQEE